MRWNFAFAALMTVVLSSAPAHARAADDVQPAPVAPTPMPVAPKVAVQVLGMVKNPGNYSLDAGARLSDALAAAGLSTIDAVNARAGIAPDAPGCTAGGADFHRVFLTRRNEASKTWASSYQIDVARVDVARARLNKDVQYDPLLRADDKIYVAECRPFRFPILVPPTFPRADRVTTATRIATSGS
ncbi:MAG: SLBB domain-containing protein [Candidatus Eremiobacteraeota bacterium]|nr:SLBB domain-containing protein [Candidatus Eremiobacteraeota bacterium]